SLDTKGLSLCASVARSADLRLDLDLRSSVLIAAAQSEYLRSSASSNDSVEIPSSPLSPLSSSSDSSPSEPGPSPQYSLPDHEEDAQDANDNKSPRSECTLEHQIFGGNSPVYLPMMATNEGSVGSDEGIPLSHMLYLLGNESGVEDTNEEMSEDQGSILMDIDANHRPPPVEDIPVAPDAPRMQFRPETFRSHPMHQGCNFALNLRCLCSTRSMRSGMHSTVSVRFLLDFSRHSRSVIQTSRRSTKSITLLRSQGTGFGYSMDT
ncbi:hypothetical protein PTTG_30531, partial [Puccinia triticina 1-1 BBBD Race 1]